MTASTSAPGTAPGQSSPRRWCWGANVLGVLMAVRSSDRPPFSPMQLERLVQLAPHVAISVHNVQITTALRGSQAEVLEANASLEAKVRERTAQITRAKQEWERTFDAIDEPISLLDGYVIRRTNSAYARRVSHSGETWACLLRGLCRPRRAMPRLPARA